MRAPCPAGPRRGGLRHPPTRPAPCHGSRTPQGALASWHAPALLFQTSCWYTRASVCPSVLCSGLRRSRLVSLPRGRHGERWRATHSAREWRRGSRGRLDLEDEPLLRVPRHVDPDGAAPRELAEEQLLGEPVLELCLDHAPERPRAEERAETLLRQKAAGGGGEYELDLPTLQFAIHFGHELVHHPGHHLRPKPFEAHDFVKSIAELGAEQPLHRPRGIAFGLAREADRAARHLPGAKIRSHDERHMAEVGLAARVVG